MKASYALTFSADSNTNQSGPLDPKAMLLKEIDQLDDQLRQRDVNTPCFRNFLELMLDASEVTSFTKLDADNQFKVTLDKDYQFDAFGDLSKTIYLPKELTIELDKDALEVRFPGNNGSNITGPYGSKMMVYGYVNKISIDGEQFKQSLSLLGGLEKEETAALERKMQEWEARIDHFKNPGDAPQSGWKLW